MGVRVVAEANSAEARRESRHHRGERAQGRGLGLAVLPAPARTRADAHRERGGGAVKPQLNFEDPVEF